MKLPFLTLGTVQFGHPYGVRRDAPLMTNDEVQQLLRQAVRAGIRHFDTASAYGLAERRLGEARTSGILPADAVVITKTPAELRSDTVADSLVQSLKALRQPKLDVLMLHRWAHRHAEGGAIWGGLLAARSEGLVGALGASVYSPEEACEAARDPDVTHLQIPCNVLDWRWEGSEFPSIKASRPDLTVYARSIYLQGILITAPSYWPSLNSVNAQETLDRLDALVAATGRQSRKELCFAYVQSLPWVDSMVVGMESVEQLKENSRLAALVPLTGEEREKIRLDLPEAPETLLNPALWGSRA